MANNTCISKSLITFVHNHLEHVFENYVFVKTYKNDIKMQMFK